MIHHFHIVGDMLYVYAAPSTMRVYLVAHDGSLSERFIPGLPAPEPTINICRVDETAGGDDA